jgi:hypothetical protein
MSKPIGKVETFMHPSGIIEQHYYGVQTGVSVGQGVGKVRHIATKLSSQNKKVLLLVDLTKVKSTDIPSHIAAVKGMREVPFDKIAIYGPLRMQVLLNGLAIVADKHDKARAFETRIEALRWLRRKAR